MPGPGGWRPVVGKLFKGKRKSFEDGAQFPNSEEWSLRWRGTIIWLSEKTPATSPSTGVDGRFTGQIRDTETGMDYFNARYFTGLLGDSTVLIQRTQELVIYTQVSIRLLKQIHTATHPAHFPNQNVPLPPTKRPKPNCSPRSKPKLKKNKSRYDRSDGDCAHVGKGGHE